VLFIPNVNLEIDMKISKHTGSSMKAPYSVCYGYMAGKKVIASGSETVGGEFNLYTGDAWKPVPIVKDLGGIMAILFAEMSGVPTIITAEGLHPNFITRDAGVSIYCAENGVYGPWVRSRVADFPYIHRIALVNANGIQTVVAATLCGKKKDKDDWSNPGSVYAVQLQKNNPPFEVKTTTVLEGVKKNHGMFVQSVDDRETVYVSGEEGLFAIHVPKETGDWVVEKILDEPISELALYDLDDDGNDEIVAIQPFHGDMVCIYKKEKGTWSRVFEMETELGHGIWAGNIGGKNGFVLGSRAGKRDFCIYTIESSEPWSMRKCMIEKGTGTAQLAVIHEPENDLIVSTNNYLNEIALYTVYTQSL
jgi:hypothetical protein